MRKTIPEIQKEIVSAIKKSGIDTDYSLFMKMGVKGEVNMHQTIQKPLRVSFKTKILAVAFHEGPNGRVTFNYLVKERGKDERWSLLGEPLKFKESTFQMKRILKRIESVK